MEIDFFKGVAAVLLLICLLVLSVLIGTRVMDEKFKECVVLASKYIPNANDTEDRSNFIKDCYQNKNE